MSAKEHSLEGLLRGSAGENGIDRKALAGLLLEAARSIDRERAAQVAGVAPADPRLAELRRILLGAEIAELARLSRQFDDPEAFAEAVSRVLPSAVARAASRDEQLAQVLAPTVEQATQTSIRSDPRTLVNIMHPVILPAIRKSIIEIIDESFQSLNESLKHSFTLQGLKWRIEAWRSGKTFAEVVLKHTLVFQVEHVFLIHRTSGLLVSHVTAERAASQDPQLVSSMLSAIQDFVRDSFSGGGSQGVDTMRLGELLLWCEPGPFASLVAVIRGNPPESLHNTLREVLTRIHEDHGRALEKFDGDSAPFLDVEARLAELVKLRQEADRRARPRFPWLLVPVAVALLFAGGWLVKQWRHEANLWEGYVQRLKAEPGIVVTKADRENGRWNVSGLRDPLAADPAQLLRESGLDPERVVASWQPYQALNAPLVLKRLGGSLNPPPTVTFAVANDAIVATGSASSAWLQRARNLVGGDAARIARRRFFPGARPERRRARPAARRDPVPFDPVRLQRRAARGRSGQGLRRPRGTAERAHRAVVEAAGREPRHPHRAFGHDRQGHVQPVAQRGARGGGAGLPEEAGRGPRAALGAGGGPPRAAEGGDLRYRPLGQPPGVVHGRDR